jgi:hypothetical protein
MATTVAGAMVPLTPPEAKGTPGVPRSPSARTATCRTPADRHHGEPQGDDPEQPQEAKEAATTPSVVPVTSHGAGATVTRAPTVRVTGATAEGAAAVLAAAAPAVEGGAATTGHAAATNLNERTFRSPCFNRWANLVVGTREA